MFLLVRQTIKINVTCYILIFSLFFYMNLILICILKFSDFAKPFTQHGLLYIFYHFATLSFIPYYLLYLDIMLICSSMFAHLVLKKKSYLEATFRVVFNMFTLFSARGLEINDVTFFRSTYVDLRASSSFSELGCLCAHIKASRDYQTFLAMSFKLRAREGEKKKLRLITIIIIVLFRKLYYRVWC